MVSAALSAIGVVGVVGAVALDGEVGPAVDRARRRARLRRVDDGSLTN
jgi:hypothetical protein